MTETTTHPSAMSADEMFETVTGFDELAITKTFGARLSDMATEDSMNFVRALVFTHRRREGDTDAQARTTTLGLPMRELLAYFEPDVAEPMPEEPVSEQGKGDSPDA